MAEVDLAFCKPAGKKKKKKKEAILKSKELDGVI